MAIQPIQFKAGSTRKETYQGVSQAAQQANEAYSQFQKEIAQKHGIKGGQVVIQSQKIQLADKLGLATGGNFGAKEKAADEYLNAEWKKQSGLSFNPYGRSNFGTESELLKQSGYDITDYLALEAEANKEDSATNATPEAMSAEKAQIQKAISEGVYVNPEVLSKYGLTQSPQAVAPGTPQQQQQTGQTKRDTEKEKQYIIKRGVPMEQYTKEDWDIMKKELYGDSNISFDETGLAEPKAPAQDIGQPQAPTGKRIANTTELQQIFSAEQAAGRNPENAVARTTGTAIYKRDLALEQQKIGEWRDALGQGIPQTDEQKRAFNDFVYEGKTPTGVQPTAGAGQPAGQAPETGQLTGQGQYLPNEDALQQAREQLAAFGIPQNEWGRYISSPDANGKVFFTPPTQLSKETNTSIDNVINGINSATTEEEKNKLISDFIALAASKGLDFPESYIRAMTATTSDEKEKIKQDIYDKYGISDLEEKIKARPTETYEDIYKRISGDLELQSLRDEINVIRAKIAQVEEARDQRTKEFNDNPFLSEFGRVGNVRQVADEASKELTRLTNQLTLTQNVLSRGEDEAQNTATRILNEFDQTRDWNREDLADFTNRANADIEAQYALLNEEDDKLVAKYFPEFVQKYQTNKGVDLTTEFKDWTLAGGEAGTGMTYAKWIDRNVKKASGGGGETMSLSATEKKKLEAAGLLNAPREQQLAYLYPPRETEKTEEEKQFEKILNEQRDILAQSGSDYWGIAWDTIKGRYPDIPNETLDQLLNKDKYYPR